MKTKLLSTLRQQSKRKSGVFKNDDGTYVVVWDKSVDFYDISEFDIHQPTLSYQILYDGVKSLHEAIQLCDEVRREWMISKVREMKYNNKRRCY